MKLLVPSLRPDDVVVVGRVMLAMALGLVPLGAMVLMKWVYFAFEDGRTVFIIQIPVTIVLGVGAYVSTLFLPGEWWVVAVAGAMSLSNLVAVLLRMRGLMAKMEGLDLPRILRLHVQLVIAATVSGTVGWAVLKVWGFSPDDSFPQALSLTLLVGVTMTAIYVLGLRIMRVEELQGLVAPILHKISRRRAG